MNRAILVGVAGVAIAVGCVSGCSSNNSKTSPSTSSPSSGTPDSVIIGGQAQNVSGPVTCTPSGSNINIGIGDPSQGVGAVVSNSNPPAVHAVGLGNANGLTLGYSDAGSQGNAQATKTGNSYTITGTATGIDPNNSQQQVTKPFEMNVTCPWWRQPYSALVIR